MFLLLLNPIYYKLIIRSYKNYYVYDTYVVYILYYLYNVNKYELITNKNVT